MSEAKSSYNNVKNAERVQSEHKQDEFVVPPSNEVNR